MSFNPYRRLQHLVAGPPTDVGQVASVEPDGVILTLLTGEQIRARGTADLGTWVYVRAGVIEGPAPALTGLTMAI